MKIEIRRIGLFSAIKTLFLLGGVAGFFLGILQWLLLLTIQRVGETLPPDLYGLGQSGISELLDAGIGALGVFLPVFGALAGAVGGVFCGALLGGVYNIASRIWGGLEIEGVETEQTAPVAGLPRGPAQPGQTTPLPTVEVPPVSSVRPSQGDSERRPPPMYE